MRDFRRAPGLLAVDDFLAWEAQAVRRHEYVAGRVYAMSGTTARHNQIVSNIHSHLRTAAAGGPCRGYVIDLKVRVARDRIYYPDAIVVCAPHGGDAVVFDDPCFIVEVTSRSTRRIDHGEKLDAYLAMSSLQAYMIAEHDRALVTLHARDEGGTWQRHEVSAQGELAIPCPRSRISLDQIYAGVDFPTLRVREELADDDEDTWVVPALQ
ncbi:MAG: Uma2 family endonuclease [bacterium]